MAAPTPQQLLRAARAAAAERDVSSVLEQIDSALLVSVGPKQTGELHLARAIALQCSHDVVAAARETERAFSLLRTTDDVAIAAYAGAAGAVMFHRARDVERSVDLAVDAMILLGYADPRDENALSASNALAQVFQQLSSYDVATQLATQTFANSKHLKLHVRGHYAFNVGQCMVEATHNHPKPDPAWLDLALEAATYLEQSPQQVTTLLTAAIKGEVFLLRDDPTSYAAHSEQLDFLTSEDHDLYAQLGERLVPWHQLVRATGAVRWGDPHVAIALLAKATNQLHEIGDEHRFARALALSAEAKLVAGDPAGSAEDAIALAKNTRATQTEQVGRLAALIARRAELERDRSELNSRAERLALEASIDSVTGLRSRRWLELRLDALSDSSTTIGILMVDLDHFKAVNDTRGHQTGDEVLAQVGELLQCPLRTRDCARYGGDEFVLIIEESNLDDVERLAEKILGDVRDYEWGNLDPGLALTASCGIAAGPAATVRELVRSADAALYEAKSRGRDRHAIHDLFQTQAPGAVS